jgi:hypothetical protein
MSGATSGGRRASPEEYARLELRAHALLAGVPLHDVWLVDLPAAARGCTLVELRERVSLARIASSNAAVRCLFRLRAWLGTLFGWDREPARAPAQSFLHRLTPDDRERSLLAPGTPEGPFRVLFVSPRESIAEIQNATVHAFSVFALVERDARPRLYWAIYLLPVSRLTAWYMRLIDPFRRAIVYPAALRAIQRAWEHDPR